MKTLILPVTLMLVAACTNGKSDVVENEQPQTELSIPAGGQEFQLFQRTNKKLSSKNGNAHVAIGDITGGQTMVTLIANDTTVVFEKSIHEGDTLDFKFGNDDYKITCLEMINVLVGNDLVNLKIMK